MIMKWLRENKIAAGTLTFLRLYLGYEWLTAGWGKITGPEPFNATGFMNKIVETPVTSHGEVLYPTYNAFIENIALPNVKLFSFMVAWGEFLIGLGLILGCLTTAAMFFGLMMNFMFMFGGTVSTNPWMVLLDTIILVAGFNAGKFGADYFVIPYIKNLFKGGKHKNTTAGKGKPANPALNH